MMDQLMGSDPAGRSADLRTRIAAALARADQDWCSDRPLYEDMADAVIRELGLRECDIEDCRCTHEYVAP